MLQLLIAITFACLAILMFSPYLGWLLAYLLRPVIEISWRADYIIFLGLRPIDFFGALLPLIIGLRMLLLRSDRPRQMILGHAWLVYSTGVLCGTIMFTLDSDYVGAASFLLRTLNGLVAFYSVQVWFGTRERFKALLIALLVGGLFPMGQGLYEIVTGQAWIVRLGFGDQIRISGMYQNLTNLRYYAYSSLAAIALYWAYFARRHLLIKLLFLAYAGVCALVLFRLYSKAAFAAIALAGLVWIVFGRKFMWPVIIIVIGLVINTMTGNEIVKQIERSFTHEISVVEGESESDKLFNARVGNWRAQLDAWSRDDLANRLFGGRGGGQAARGGGHNDYVRALIQTGIYGAAAYVWLLAAVGITLLRRILRRRTPLNIVAAMIFLAWLVDTWGLTPAVYPHFQAFAWAIIGIALAGVHGLEEVRKSASASQSMQASVRTRSRSKSGVPIPS